ncbi:MAG: 2-succinyl-5-enolpyruvyl-6-hydroxy-3-cyclohexene-1-carboxylic-acid synthase [Actinomycetota bacterium]
MSSTAATFCATLVDEWIRAGVTRAFAAPGSRSTPLALALAADRRMQLEMFHDERSAGFAALGHATATGRPTVVTCTSGTAAAHFHAPVIEADLSAVPLIVATTDRPPELWDIGAPQTVNQSGLYGRAVRFYAEPGVPDDAQAGSWRSLAARAVTEAAGSSGAPGPVHLNLSFRDPLVGEPGPLPPARPGGGPWHRDLRATRSGTVASDQEVDEVFTMIRGLSGVIVAGNGTSDPNSVLAIGRRLGWPVLADHRSGCRAEDRAIAHFDQLLRHERFAAAARPDVVLRFGEPPSSKVLAQWLGGLDADIIAAPGPGRWIDPERIATAVVTEAGLARALSNRIDADYRPSGLGERWKRADVAAEAVIADRLAGIGRTTEPGVARAVIDGMPTGSSLVVASSMPVRDVEWFGRNRRDVRVYANRGANGIDGLIATATGVALSGSPTTLLIGDVAFLHDSSSLIALAERAVDLTIVVIDNDGGGIFSFLPQADLVAPERFELLFGTPHGTDISALCAAHRITAEAWPDDDNPKLAAGTGVRVIVATTERSDNVLVHETLNRAVADAIDQLR